MEEICELYTIKKNGMRILLTIILMTFIINTYSQKSDFDTREITKELDYELQIIDSIEYTNAVAKLIEESKINLIPRTENEIVNQYPNIFEKNDKCYEIKRIDKKPISVCNNDSINDIKMRSQYQFKGQYCDFGLIYISGYEWWGYISVDLITGIGFYTMGVPLTLDCKIIFSNSNYYGEEEISFTNMETKKQLVIGFENWTTVEVKQNNKNFYLKVEPFGRRDKEMKYIKVEIK